MIHHIHEDVFQAKDNLFVAKVTQAVQENKQCRLEPSFKVGDYVMLNTSNRRHKYYQKRNGRTTKLMPRFNGRYKVITAFLEASVYTIDMPNLPLSYSTFHVSELRPYFDNDPTIFPLHELACPGPIITSEGKEEWLVDSVMDEKKHGRGLQYLVTFSGYGPEHNCWMPHSNLLENKVLNRWEA